MIKKLGGLHKFMNWDSPILTDSGGFQVFSLSGHSGRSKKKAFISTPILTEERFLWGRRRVCRFSPIWHPPLPWLLTSAPPVWRTKSICRDSVERTTRWLARCKNEMDRLNSLPDTINPHQMLFGINQGGIYEDIRIAPCTA